MNFRIVLRFLSIQLVIIGFFMTAPLALAIYDGDFHQVEAFLIPLIGCLTIFLPLYFITGKSKRSIGNKEGFFLVAAGWTAASFLGALPFYLSGSIPSFTDAFFETTSG